MVRNNPPHEVQSGAQTHTSIGMSNQVWGDHLLNCPVRELNCWGAGPHKCIRGEACIHTHARTHARTHTRLRSPGFVNVKAPMPGVGAEVARGQGAVAIIAGDGNQEEEGDQPPPPGADRERPWGAFSFLLEGEF